MIQFPAPGRGNYSQSPVVEGGAYYVDSTESFFA